MLVVITGGAGRLGQALAAHLSDTHQVRTVDAAAAASGGAAVDLVGDLRSPDFAQQAVAGADVLVHLAPLAPTGPATNSENDRLDVAGRGTYVLLNAAVEAGVQTVVLGSTLDFFAAYPGNWRVGEGWAPQPTPEVAHLAPYLAEVSAREFARVHPLRVVCLRLGQVVDDGEVAGQPFDSRWLHLDDALQALRRAISFAPPADGPQVGWWVYHITAAGPHSRLPLTAAA